MATFHYRLEVLLEQKLKLLEEAQRNLGEKMAKLREERQRLEDLQRLAEEAKQRMEAARAARFQTDGALSAEALQRRCEEARWLEKEAGWAKDNVLGQRIAIEDAEDDVEKARAELVEANRQVEVLKTHRAKQEARFRAEQARIENIAMDDVGSAQFLQRRRE